MITNDARYMLLVENLENGECNWYEYRLGEAFPKDVKGKVKLEYEVFQNTDTGEALIVDTFTSTKCHLTSKLTKLKSGLKTAEAAETWVEENVKTLWTDKEVRSITTSDKNTAIRQAITDTAREIYNTAKRNSQYSQDIAHVEYITISRLFDIITSLGVTLWP